MSRFTERFNRPPRATDIVIFIILFVVVFATVIGLSRLAEQAANVRSILVRLDARDAADSIALTEARRLAVEDRVRHNQATECQLLEILQHRAVTRAQLNEVLMAVGRSPIVEPELPAVDAERLTKACAPYYGPR